MKNLVVVITLSISLLASSAVAQMAGDAVQRQTQMVREGKIVDIDLSEGTITLDNGLQFTLAPSLQYTSAPTLGQSVLVTYSEKDGKRIVEILDIQGTNNGAGE